VLFLFLFCCFLLVGEGRKSFVGDLHVFLLLLRLLSLRLVAFRWCTYSVFFFFFVLCCPAYLLESHHELLYSMLFWCAKI
jgi:hypothetical protein